EPGRARRAVRQVARARRGRPCVDARRRGDPSRDRRGADERRQARPRRAPRRLAARADASTAKLFRGRGAGELTAGWNCRAWPIQRRRASAHPRYEPVTPPWRPVGYRRAMDEARAVLARLQRIERLERAGAPARDLLVEVRTLLGEAEAWLRAEPARAGGVAESALERCRRAVAAAELGRAGPRPARRGAHAPRGGGGVAACGASTRRRRGRERARALPARGGRRRAGPDGGGGLW